MQIKIAERLRPFTSLPGQMVPIPKTHFSVKVYPEKVELYSLLQTNPQLVETITFSLKGPVTAFTVILDLEKEKIGVTGKESRGYFHYEILAQNAPFIELKKAPLGFKFLCDPCCLKEEVTPFLKTRLSLGCSKKGDMSLIYRRKMMEEVVPYWLFLGQMIPSLPFKKEGTCSLIDKLSFEGGLKALFLAGFEGVFCPRSFDSDYQGFDLPPLTCEQSPLPILSEGAKRILSLFVREEKELFLLPDVPKEFHCGRLLDAPFSIGRISLEWSKKQLKKVLIVPDRDAEIKLQFPKELKSVRFQKSRVSLPLVLQCKANETIQLDRFER